MILLNYVKQQFVSCTSNLLEQMYGFRKCTMFLQKWILNLQNLPRSQSLETVPICIVWPYFPNDNIVCIHKYDEYMKSIDSNVCRKPWSIFRLILQTYLLTIEYRVVQFVSNLSISEQFENTYLHFSNRFCFFLFEVVVIDAWSRYFVELLCSLVCQLTISFHTLLCVTNHVIKPRKNTKILKGWKFFSSPRGHSRPEHGSVIVHNIFAYFTLSFSAAQVCTIQERCWFSKVNFLIDYFPHRIKILFLSSQFYGFHTHTNRNNPFSR